MKHAIKENPYREGVYREIFSEMQTRQVFSRNDLIRYAVTELGVEPKKAAFDVTILLSPRLTSRIGDCRGSTSCNGHLYYLDKLPRQMRAGVRDPQQFRLRWRKYAMEPRRKSTRLDNSDLKEIADVIRSEGIVKKMDEDVWQKLMDRIED